MKRGEREDARRAGALEAAMRLLAGRALSAAEIRERLLRRGYGAADADACVRTLLSRGYLDDRTLAYNVATSSATRRMFGRIRVALELKRRGIPAAAAAEGIERAFAEVDEDEMALRAARRCGGARAPARDRPDAHHASLRVARALLRRGFSREAVGRALRTLGSASAEPPGRGGKTRGRDEAPPEECEIDDRVLGDDDDHF